MVGCQWAVVLMMNPRRRRQRLRRYQNLYDGYKHARDRGTGLIMGWQPDSFREYVRGTRAATAIVVVAVVAVVVWVVVKYLT